MCIYNQVWKSEIITPMKKITNLFREQLCFRSMGLPCFYLLVSGQVYGTMNVHVGLM